MLTIFVEMSATDRTIFGITRNNSELLHVLFNKSLTFRNRDFDLNLNSQI